MCLSREELREAYGAKLAELVKQHIEWVKGLNAMRPESVRMYEDTRGLNFWDTHTLVDALIVAQEYGYRIAGELLESELNHRGIRV